MANYMEEAFAPIEAKYRQEVLADTWGHLAPKKNKTYTGYMVFALGCFDSGHLNPTMLSFDFGDLDSSPWFYVHVNDWLQDQVDVQGLEEGKVYRFDGTFRNYQLKGKIREATLVFAAKEKR